MVLGFTMVTLTACTGPEDGSSHAASQHWTGEIDTLANGRVVVQNEGEGIWSSVGGWRVVEELRVGDAMGSGPDSFGEVVSFAVDERGQMLVLDGLASALQVFDASGGHVRTVGREGEGPGEFMTPAHISIGPERHLWIVDPGNSRISVFGVDGEHLESHRIPTPFTTLPWRGGFDRMSRYYVPTVAFRPEFHSRLVRFDMDLSPLDTLIIPTDPIARGNFRWVDNGREHDRLIPFQGRFVWRLSSQGTLWTLLTDTYQVVELGADGDTLRVIGVESDLVEVGEEERRQVLADLEPLVAAGARVDFSRLPREQPPVRSFFLSDDGHIWVEKVMPGSDLAESTFDILDPMGRYLGSLELPFRLAPFPVPIVREDLLYGVVRDANEVDFLIRARVDRR